MRVYSKEELEAGVILLLDKPKTWTSFDVVNKLRYLFRVKKIGHAGTLDPLATGLLVVCTGKATKTIDQIQNQPKVYIAEVFLGGTTASYDEETPVENLVDVSGLLLSEIQPVLARFQGQISQRPPIYSAVLINGKRAYQLARAGKATEMPERQVNIYDLTVLDYQPPRLTLQITCSKGTYIRSLAHDIGLLLGCGAYLSGLRRTAIGGYSIEDAMGISELVSLYKTSKNPIDHARV